MLKRTVMVAALMAGLGGTAWGEERTDTYKLTELDAQLIFMSLQRAPIPYEIMAPLVQKLQMQYQQAHMPAPPPASPPPAEHKPDMVQPMDKVQPGDAHTQKK